MSVSTPGAEVTNGKVNEGLILAAGNGSRIASLSGSVPKPLVPLCGVPLLEHVMMSSRAAGIERFVIVAGYRADLIRRWFADQRLRKHFRSRWLKTSNTRKRTASRPWPQRKSFTSLSLLLMADHIFEPKTARALLRQPLAEDEVILGVDSTVDRIFDLDDATKVKLRRESHR